MKASRWSLVLDSATPHRGGVHPRLGYPIAQRDWTSQLAGASHYDKRSQVDLFLDAILSDLVTQDTEDNVALLAVYLGAQDDGEPH